MRTELERVDDEVYRKKVSIIVFSCFIAFMCLLYGIYFGKFLKG